MYIKNVLIAIIMLHTKQAVFSAAVTKCWGKSSIYLSIISGDLALWELNAF